MLVAVDPHPRLGVVEKPAKLVEHGGGGSSGALEHVDAVQTLDHCTGLVHENDGNGKTRARL